MEVFVQDTQLNVSPAYLRPGFAFGGSCLPKDMRSLLYLARMNCVDLPLLESTLATNDMLVRDVADRVLAAVDASGNRRVALLGLSFKHLTDDLRESPNVALAELLIGKGVDVRVHDPVVNMAQAVAARTCATCRPSCRTCRGCCTTTPPSALDGAHVAIVSSADACGRRRRGRPPTPPVVIDLNGRLGNRWRRCAGYEGVGW